jgi:uncharacterized protein (DUF58 family)
MDALLETDDRLDSRQFQLAVKRLADSLNFGSDVSPFYGAGIDYAQSRPYQAGDPVKSIDWRVTGRTGRVHVKEYEAPKRLPVYICVDTSASMCVSSVRMSKYLWAAQIAGGLALASLSRLSPVGIIGCGERPLGVRASLSRTQVFIWLEILRRHRFNETTLLGKRLRELAGTVEERSVVMVLSDLHDPDAIPALKLMGQHHDCVALQLEDPAERSVTGVGIFRGAEAETGRTFASAGSRTWVDHTRMANELRQAGVDHLCLPTDAEFLPKLRAFLRRRDQLGRGSR